MRLSTFLIHLAGGELIDDGGLLEAVASGKIGRVCWDVFREEPSDPDDLISCNVLAAPHIGGTTDVL